MKNALIILSFFLFITGFSQVNRLYNDGYNDIASDIEKYNNNSYYISGSYSTAGDRIKNVDSFGNIIQEVVFFDGNQQFRAQYNSLEIYDDNIYFFTKQIINSTTTRYLISLTCFNLNLDTLWNKLYLESDVLVYARSFIKTSDNGFALVGLIDKGNYNYNAFILKTDSLGNYQWDQEYSWQTAGEITSIVETDDNGFIIAGSSYKYHQSYDDWYIVRTDSLGEQIWDWVLRNPEYNVPNIDNLSDGPIADLIQTQDGNFIAVGGKSYTNDPFLLKKARLLKFDIDKNIIIDTLYTEVYENDGVDANFESEFVKIREKENGNLLLLNKRQASPGSNGNRISNLYELSSNLSLITKREFGATTASPNNGEYLRDFIIEGNGSLALIGDVYLNSYFWETPYQRVWFVKTDENYCDGFGSCDTNLAINILPPDTIVKTDTVNLEIELVSNWNIDYNLFLTFYNKDLRRITYDTILNASSSYIHNIEISYNNLVSENEYPNTIEDTVYILCLIIPSDNSSKAQYFTTIRENRIIFVDSHEGIEEIETKSRFSIFPNPAHDNIQITMNNEQSDIQTVEIYNIAGRLVKSSALQGAKQSIIQIEGLDKGIYFVQIGAGIQKLIIE